MRPLTLDCPCAACRAAQGFVQIIVDAYYNKRMAWYPTEPLQMEVMACSGRRAHPADVAEWMRLVYTTLECTIPQFGGR